MFFVTERNDKITRPYILNVGCLDTSSGRTYKEGDSWTTADGCRRCQCVTGAVTCTGCQRVSCNNPDMSDCCPKCDGMLQNCYQKKYRSATIVFFVLFKHEDNK